MPKTFLPSARHRIVAALITPLIPGAGPPPTKIATVSVIENPPLHPLPSYYPSRTILKPVNFDSWQPAQRAYKKEHAAALWTLSFKKATQQGEPVQSDDDRTYPPPWKLRLRLTPFGVSAHAGMQSWEHRI
jgi:hypothetical protein